jgi:hypothetical protein
MRRECQQTVVHYVLFYQEVTEELCLAVGLEDSECLQAYSSS